ncbi:Spindle and kinetochore-associated protein 1 [Merluccius polli]|uniref:SKA complex subunit 1 n=1 Tax=Merluccius polli TaxID=89951 RepID=A0AA47NQ50_MERPO|nr:Spindle and kinetochore-associated protein 1 [Merluccius polli]
MSDLEEVSRHIHDKISSVRRMLDLSVIAPQLPPSQVKKLFQEVRAVESLLQELETCVARQGDQLKSLKVLLLSCYRTCHPALQVPPYRKEYERSFQHDFEALQHLKDNVPKHMPKRGNEPAPSQDMPAETQPIQRGNARNKSHVKQMEFVTTLEFDNIPQYMKGRVIYEQLNAAVRSINDAVSGKYKILRQPAKSLNNNTRKLSQRFKEEETKDTKGQFFVVETDIREFTQMKIDKRFQGIMSMLRHCQRLRESRGNNLTRYVLL